MVQQGRIFNFSQGITGVLFCADKHFFQVLEGEQSDVEELYARIRDDARHTKVTTLLDALAPRRLFPDWSLGFGAVNAAALARLSAYLDPRHRSALLLRMAKAQEAVLADLLRRFVAEQLAPSQLVSCR